ncbi:LamG-like jellyroll fold domain-containing protein [Luteolibacter soli]|uniref:LamG-like jellyroll fold domain-containing protein n=1 Tax=Luteolibacter soli TaxID=3135280 RepID=A0ABU9B484_9BACT
MNPAPLARLRRLVSASLFAAACFLPHSVQAGQPPQAPSFNSDGQAVFTVGSPNEFTVQTGGYPPPSITCFGDLPAGVTFSDQGNGTATFSGGAAGDGGMYMLALSAYNGVDPQADQPFTLYVFEPTSVTSADHASFTVGVPSQFTVTTAGGYPEAGSVSLTGGTLPTGLNFTDNGPSGSIQGVPAAGTDGTYTYQIIAHNDGGDTVQNFTLTIGGPPAASPCVARPAGIIGWWAADGNALDLQANADATLAGGAGFAPGLVNRAFALDGSAAYVALGNPNVLKAGALTIEAWVKPSALPANGQMEAIVTKWNNNPAKNSSGDAYGLYLINNGGTLQLRAMINPTSVGAEMSLQGGTLPLNQWAHVAVAYENATGVFAIFVNGLPVAQSDTGLPIQASDVPVMIGRQSDNVTPRHFAGLIDEVAMYARALTLPEISGIYQARENGKCKSRPVVEPPVNLLAWWTGDRTAVDLQEGRVATLTSGVTFAPGVVGQAFDLYGAQAGIQIPHDPAWNFGSEQFTIATWVRFFAGDSYQIIAAHEQPGGSLGWRFLFNGFTLQFQMPGGNNAGVYPVVPVIQRWYHLAVTRSGSTFRFYVDGVQVGGDQIQSAPVPSVQGPLSLGYSPGFPNQAGRIDEFQIVHRALSAQEIAGIYQGAQRKTFALYVANAGSGTISKLDATGNGVPIVTGLANPRGLAIDAAGSLFLAENGAGRILKFPTTGGFSSFASVIDPQGLAFDGTGNLHVVSSSQNAVEVFDSAGLPLGAVPGGLAALNHPTGLVFDDRGNLLVSNSGSHLVTKYDTSTWSVESSSPLLASPAGLAITSFGNPQVTSTTGHRLVETDATGTGSIIAEASAGLNGPRDVQIDFAGNRFVCNAGDDTITKIDPSGVATPFAVLAPGSAPAFMVLQPKSPLVPLVQVDAVNRQPNGHFVIQGITLPHALVTIRATTDLTLPMTTLGETTADETGAYQFVDTGSTNLTRRFYTANW